MAPVCQASRRWRSTSSTGRTSSSATTSRCRPTSTPTAIEVAAVRGVLGSVLGMLEQGATHVGVATDHVVESFRNDLWIGYKTSAGMDPELLAQFPMLEDGLRALGRRGVADGRARSRRRARRRPRGWPRTTAASTRASDLHARQGPRSVRRGPDRGAARPAHGTGDLRRGRRPRALRRRPPRRSPTTSRSWATPPTASPACPGGARSRPRRCSTRYEHLDAIPDDAADWDVSVRGAAKLAATLATARDAAELFLDLATLRTDARRRRPSTTGSGTVRRPSSRAGRAAWRAAAVVAGARLAERRWRTRR